MNSISLSAPVAVAPPALTQQKSHARDRNFTLVGMVGAALLVVVSTSYPGEQSAGAPGLDPSDGSKTSHRPIQPPIAEPPVFLQLPRDVARRRNAETPFSTAPNPAARPFAFNGNDAALSRAVDCLASAQYYEAGGDFEGQRAVAQVVLNRVRHPAFPATVCGVVFQGSERSTGCQFTFTCDGALARRPVPGLWERTRAIAREALNGGVYAPVGLSTHYHTDWVVPVWSASLEKVTAVHTHLFFRWKGGWGRAAAFSMRAGGEEPFVEKLRMLSSAHSALVAESGSEPGDAITEAASQTRAGAIENLADALPAGINLRGSRLALVHPEGGAFGFILPRAMPGSFGLLALDVCRGRSFCKVMGWTDPAELPRGFPVSFDAQRAMAFLYVRDGTLKGEIIGWRCDLFPRRDPIECLGSQSTRWDAVQAGNLVPS